MWMPEVLIDEKKHIGSGQATGHYLKQISQARQQAIEPSFSKVYDITPRANELT